MKRVRYPSEFKAEAVKQVTERGHGVVDVAKFPDWSRSACELARM
jgi:transposase-like protein